MLKSFYTTLDEIPEGERQHYNKIGDRYVLELDGQHPVQAQVTTLIQEKKDETQKLGQRAATAEAEVATLKTAAANQPTLPSGHVAVPADEAKLLDSVKELGKPDEIKKKLEERDTFETENVTLKRAGLLRQIADDNKFNLSVFAVLDERAGKPEYEQREVTVDGKTLKPWHQKDSGKWVTVKDFQETHNKDFLSSLTAQGSTEGGTKVIGQTADDKDKKKPDLYSKIRKDAEERKKKVREESIPLEKRLGQAA